MAKGKLAQVGKKEKDIKDVLDQVAAVEILQQWLDQKATLLPEVDPFLEDGTL